MSKTIRVRGSIGLFLGLGIAVASCGIFMKTDQGLFDDANFSTTGVRNGNELRGLWELDANSYSNPTTGTTPTNNYNTQTRMRLEIKSQQDTLLRVTTYCESRNSNDYNTVQATYVNADAWVRIQSTSQGGMAGTTTYPNGQINIQQFQNVASSGEKNAGCVTPLQVGTYSFQVQDGRMYLNAMNPMNGTGGQGNYSGSYSFTKVRD